MPQVLAKGMTVEYESIGDDHAPAMVLTVGLGAQLTAWPVPFCKRLTRQRFHVERFDNRSAGLSIKFDAVRAGADKCNCGAAIDSKVEWRNEQKTVSVE